MSGVEDLVSSGGEVKGGLSWIDSAMMRKK